MLLRDVLKPLQSPLRPAFSSVSELQSTDRSLHYQYQYDRLYRRIDNKNKRKQYNEEKKVFKYFGDIL